MRLHGFGLKLTGLRVMANHLASSDSMAWSFSGRKNPRLEACEHRAKNCANCLRFALQWRDRVIETIAHRRKQLEPMDLFLSRPESIERDKQEIAR